MPVDYHSYLLSSSPPGFELQCGFRNVFSGGLDRDKSPSILAASPVGDMSFLEPWGARNGFLPGVIYDGSRDVDDCAKRFDPDGGSRTPPASPRCDKSSLRAGLTRSKSGKRVSFADDLGGCLVQVRVMTERPDSPPLLHPGFLSTLTGDASPPGGAATTTTSAANPPSLKLNFPQPASDYAAFRNRLESGLVALENACLKGDDLAGTIKVKNVAFEKRVAVRYTTDAWTSYADADADYVPSGGAGGGEVALPYDTFSFRIRVPPALADGGGKLEFAVRYSVNGADHWDNNGGRNYEVVPSEWRCTTADSHNTTDAVVFSLDHSDSWTEFCGWNNMSCTVPYY